MSPPRSTPAPTSHNVAEYQRFSISNYHAWLATIDETVRF